MRHTSSTSPASRRTVAPTPSPRFSAPPPPPIPATPPALDPAPPLLRSCCACACCCCRRAKVGSWTNKWLSTPVSALQAGLRREEEEALEAVLCRAVAVGCTCRFASPAPQQEVPLLT